MRQAFESAAQVRLAVYGLVILAGGASSGCISADSIKAYLQYNDSSNDFVMGWRNTVWARQAWHARKAQFVDEPQFHAFGQGFRDGYVAVASGGNGCPPPLPPRRYWNWRYQTAEGQGQVAAWFAGYPHGARAADEEGAGLYQQIQVSHPIEVQYSPEFQSAAGAEQMIRDLMPGAVQPGGPPLEQVMPVPGQPPRTMPDLPAPQSGASWEKQRAPSAAPSRVAPAGGGLQPREGSPPAEVAPASYQASPSPAGFNPMWGQPSGSPVYGVSPAAWPGK